MYLSNRIASSSTGDSLAHLAERAAGKVVDEARETVSAAQLSGGSHDPSAHVSLSVDALLVLSASREEAEALPVAQDISEIDISTLQRREYESFGHFLDEGDRKAYYRAYLDFFAGMRPEEQNSERYAGMRESAVGALRAIAYNERVADMTALDIPVAAAEEAPTRRSTPISAILQPGIPEFEHAARVTGRISRATSMYTLGF